jgi:polyhydroxybutyrate depolymerase
MTYLRALGISVVSLVVACGSSVSINGATGSSGRGATNAGGSGTTSNTGAGGDRASSSGPSASNTSGTGGATGNGCGMAKMPGLYDVTIQSGGMARTFHVYVPASYDASKPSMVVFVFHGLTQHGVGSDIFAIEYVSQMDPVADAQGFIAVYPDGVQNSWNAGTCCGGAVTAKIDDVGFFDDMLAKISSTYCLDPKRVYAAGLSNGGFFSNRLGCERANVVAAIGPVAGPLDITPCTPSRAVPVFEVHGTADPVVPYDGGGLSGADAVAQAITTWEGLDKCNDPMPSNVYTNGAASCTAETMCGSGAAVELCVIQGGGHQWPGGKDDLLGTFSTDLDTSTKMVTFFQAHALP